MDPLSYYVVLGATYLFALAVGHNLRGTYAKYAQVANQAGLSGAQVARDILDANGLGDVQLVLARGKLSDHYDPRTRVIRLSSDIARNASVAAMAVSAHEAAHALQDADDYAPLELRTSLYPLVSAGARWGSLSRSSARSLGASQCFFWECWLISARLPSTSLPFPSSSTRADGRWRS